MANIKFSKKLFEKEIGKLNDEMQMRIAMFGTPVESVTDTEIEIEVFPNRPDLLSYQGFKKSFLAFLGKKTGLREYKVKKPEKDYKVIIDPSVKDVRPYTVCAIVKELILDENKIKELIDVQEKLHNTIGRRRKKVAIGIYPLDKIKLPITFKAMEPDKIKFIPLESSKEMSGLQILQRHPIGKEYAHLLAGKVKFPIFVDADNNVLSMPPIINSELTGRVVATTKDVFVECSGTDLNALNKCLNILVTTMDEMGGKIYQMELSGLKLITPDLTSEKMKISLVNTNKLLGLNLSEKELGQCLEKMGHNYKDGFAEIASWRNDILHEVDLIEDVAIAYGYENFIEDFPEIATVGKEDFKEIIKRKISEIFVGLNMLEVSNYHLTKRDDQFLKMGINEKNEKEFIEVEGSKTDYTILRKDLSHYLLKNFSENIDSEYPQFIFEMGRTFNLIDEKIVEGENLACAVTPGNFTQIKQTLEYFFRMINLEVKFKEPLQSPVHFIEGRVGEIILDEKVIGYIGEIHPRILRNWKIKMPVALFEINLEKVFDKLK